MAAKPSHGNSLLVFSASIYLATFELVQTKTIELLQHESSDLVPLLEFHVYQFTFLCNDLVCFYYMGELLCYFRELSERALPKISNATIFSGTVFGNFFSPNSLFSGKNFHFYRLSDFFISIFFSLQLNFEFLSM